MSLRFMLFGSIALLRAVVGSAAAQEVGDASGTGTGSVTTVAPAAPTSLLPQPSLDSRGQESLTRQDARIDGGLTSNGTSSPGTSLDGTQGQIPATPVPMNAPSFGSSIVPPLTGTSVPPFSGATGLGLPTQQLQTPQAPRAEPQFIVLSGSLFRGTVDQPNVISVGPGFTGTGQPRGLSVRSLDQSQPVLQGTLEAPRVIALRPEPGNVLVFQGSSSIPARGVNAASGQFGAQIVEVPVE